MTAFFKDPSIFSGTPEVQQVVKWADRQFRRLQDFWLKESWDDLRAPATSLKTGGTPPTVNTTFGWLEFAHNQDEFVFQFFQLPHSWKVGTVLKPHVHWMKTTTASGEVEWQFQYRWLKTGEVLDAAWTTLSSLTPVVSDGGTQYQSAITSFGDITTDGIDISDMLICKLTRLGSSYSGASHYAAAAALVELDIHFMRDGFGSPQVYRK